MILPSTIRKLQAANKKVHRIIWPAHQFTMNGTTLDLPEMREYFATERGLNDALEAKFELILAGAWPKYQADMIPASALDWLTGREETPRPYRAYA